MKAIDEVMREPHSGVIVTHKDGMRARVMACDTETITVVLHNGLGAEWNRSDIVGVEAFQFYGSGQ